MIRISREHNFSLQFISFLFLVFLAGTLQSQNTEENWVSCDSLFKLRMVDFDIDHLPDGFLDCLGASENDISMMHQVFTRHSSTSNQIMTVGMMKELLDSVDEQRNYRQSMLDFSKCQKTFQKKPQERSWKADSAQLTLCGIDPELLAWASSNLKFEDFKSFTHLVAKIDQDLDAILVSRGESILPDQELPHRRLGNGLLFYHGAEEELNIFLENAKNNEQAALIYFRGGRPQKLRAFEQNEWRDFAIHNLMNQIDAFVLDSTNHDKIGKNTYAEAALQLIPNFFEESEYPIYAPALIWIDEQGKVSSKLNGYTEKAIIRGWLEKQTEE
jgi:hypothetical protein